VLGLRILSIVVAMEADYISKARNPAREDSLEKDIERMLKNNQPMKIATSGLRQHEGLR